MGVAPITLDFLESTIYFRFDGGSLPILLTVGSSNDCHIFQSNLRSFNSEYQKSKNPISFAKLLSAVGFHGTMKNHLKNISMILNFKSFCLRKQRIFFNQWKYFSWKIVSEVTGFLKWLGPAWMIAMPLLLGDKKLRQNLPFRSQSSSSQDTLIDWRFQSPTTKLAGASTRFGTVKRGKPIRLTLIFPYLGVNQVRSGEVGRFLASVFRVRLGEAMV